MGFNSVELCVGMAEVGFNSLELGVGMQRRGLTALNWVWACRGGVQ